MNQAIKFGRWSVISDVESTKAAYATIAKGAPETCGCDPCKNFAAQRSEVYPASVVELFERLGVATNREAEIYHLARLESGKHLYGGWFHFVGSILDGRDAKRQVAENVWQPDLEPMSDRFSLGFTSTIELAPESFAGFQLVQLEFSTQLPWALDATEPP
jgi:hypothetical protein